MLSILGEVGSHMANHIIINTFLLKKYVNNFSRQVDNRYNLKKMTVIWWMIYRSSGKSMTSYKSKVDSYL